MNSTVQLFDTYKIAYVKKDYKKLPYTRSDRKFRNCVIPLNNTTSNNIENAEIMSKAMKINFNQLDLNSKTILSPSNFIKKVIEQQKSHINKSEVQMEAINLIKKQTTQDALEFKVKKIRHRVMNKSEIPKTLNQAKAEINQNVEIDSVLNLDKWIKDKNLPKNLNEPVHLFYRDKCMKKISQKDKEKIEQFMNSNTKQNIKDILQRKTIDYIIQGKNKQRNLLQKNEINNIKTLSYIIPQIIENSNDKLKEIQPKLKTPFQIQKIDHSNNNNKLEFELSMLEKLNSIKLLLREKNEKFENLTSAISQMKLQIQQLKNKICEIEEMKAIKPYPHPKTIKTNNKSNIPSGRNIQNIINQKNEHIFTNLEAFKESIYEIHKNCMFQEKKRAALKGKIENIKYEIERIKDDLSIYFHNILEDGIDTRQEGLSWVIKHLLNNQIILKISKMPKFLDKISKSFLINISKKEIEFNKLIDSNKSIQNKNPNSNDATQSSETRNQEKITQFERYRSSYVKKRNPIYDMNIEVVNQEEIKNEIQASPRTQESLYEEATDRSKLSKFARKSEDEKNIEIRRKEIKQLKLIESSRIIREYLKGSYQFTENAPVEQILISMFGSQSMKMELDRLNRYKEEYLKLKSNRISTFYSLSNQI